MFIVMIIEYNLPQDVILVTANRDKAIAQLLDTCSTEMSNWEEYDEEDREEIITEGYSSIGQKTVVILDTDGWTSDKEILTDLLEERDKYAR